MPNILNVIVIAAHPDEPEIYAGAISALTQRWVIG